MDTLQRLRDSGRMWHDLDPIALWDAEVARHYERPGDPMFSPEVVTPTVDALSSLAAGRPALEFAVGTGRVALPLRARGGEVHGIEASTAMLDVLRTKADEQRLPVTLGDMASATAPGGPGSYGLVYLVFNTIANLLTQREQVACFRNAARHLVPGGAFVVELWVPQLRALPPGVSAMVPVAEPGYLLVDTYDVLHQRVVSHHVRWTAAGEPTLDRTPHRYVWPAELDLMAQLAGFEFQSRWADWASSAFTAESPSHVSVYRLPG